MQLSDLNLGDTITLSDNYGAGNAVVIALDPADELRPVMIGWYPGDNSLLVKGPDNLMIARAQYLPNAKSFPISLWVKLENIGAKVSSMGMGVAPIKEQACRTCSKMNDLGAAKCWWCECINPTSARV